MSALLPPSSIGKKQDGIPPGSTQLPLFTATCKLCFTTLGNSHVYSY